MSSVHNKFKEVSTELELIELCNESVWDKKNSCHLQYDTSCFFFMDKIGAVKFQKWWDMSKKIQRRNIWMCSVAAISEVTNIAVGNRLNILLREFSEAGLCVVEYPEGKYNSKNVTSERRRVIFNPNLVWKGCYRQRRLHRKEWDNNRYGFSLRS